MFNFCSFFFGWTLLILLISQLNFAHGLNHNHHLEIQQIKSKISFVHYGPYPPDCGALPVIEHGYLMPGLTSTYHVGEIRMAKCSQGYKMVGAGHTICLWTGWTNPGKCVKDIPDQCQDQPVIENGCVVDPGGNRVGTRRRFQCNTGFHTYGIPSVICDAFGKWVAMGICTAINSLAAAPSTTTPTTTTTTTTTLATSKNDKSLLFPSSSTTTPRQLLVPVRSSTRRNAITITTTSTTVASDNLATRRIVTVNPTVAKTCCGFTPKVQSSRLIEAARQGDKGVLLAELNGYANPNSNISQGAWTPLQWAANNGQTDAIVELLKCCADPNARNAVGSTALIFAVRSGIVQSVQILLAVGADVNATNQFGSSALLFAAQGGQSGIVRMLLANGADRNTVDNNGNSALTWAVRSNSSETIKALLLFADETGGGGGGGGGGTKVKEFVNLANQEGETPLMSAARLGSVEIATILFDNGADANLKDNKGFTALYIAEMHGKRDVAELVRRKLL